MKTKVGLKYHVNGCSCKIEYFKSAQSQRFHENVNWHVKRTFTYK